MVECKVRENKMVCNCSYSCNRKGLCCACLRYHRDREELPACYFPGDTEKTYDRSIENYLRTIR
ncbi:MAG: hypothetical protein NT038_06255 [Euryarchaeota archaeon]|nr:hypothetical protein [Euryarchaeota archaeon]